MLSRATSTLLLILLLVIPRHINAQEKKVDIKTLRMKMTLYVAKDEEGKPTTSTISFAKDGKGNLYLSINDIDWSYDGSIDHVVIELILADGFVYVRNVGANSERRDWIAMSINTLKAIGSDLLDVAGVTESFESSNMQREGTKTLSGGKTRVYVNNKPITATTDSRRDLVNELLKVLYVNKPITATTDSVKDLVNALHKAIADGVRKVEIKEFDAETNELVVSITVRVFAINSRILIKVPKLPDKPRNPDEYLFFNFEHCKSSPDKPCQKNEMILEWNAEHVKNAVGVILFREDRTPGKFVRLRVFKEIKGTFTQTLCEATRYRIVPIDKRRRPLCKTVNTMEITDADLEKCP